MKKFIYACVLLFIPFLYGCSGIAQPVASRQLVENNYETDYEAAPEAIWGSLSDMQEGEKIVVLSKPMVLGDWFFSASGRKCRELRGDNLVIRIACKDNDSAKWFLVKPVLSSYSDQLNEMGGAI